MKQHNSLSRMQPTAPLKFYSFPSVCVCRDPEERDERHKQQQQNILSLWRLSPSNVRLMCNKHRRRPPHPTPLLAHIGTHIPIPPRRQPQSLIFARRKAAARCMILRKSKRERREQTEETSILALHWTSLARGC